MRESEHRGVIWDIQEDHLDEADFMLETWSAAIDSPRYTLSKLESGPERRLTAHIDGLLVGGKIVVEQLLLPVLAEPDENCFRTAAAVLSILEGAGLEACARVLEALGSAKETGRQGVVLGLGHAQRAGLASWLVQDLHTVSNEELGSRLEVLAHHRVDANTQVPNWLQRDSLEVRRAAAKLARHAAAPDVHRHLYPVMNSDDAELRWAAIESGLIRGLAGAWSLVCEDALGGEQGRYHREALAWLAMLGNPGAQQRLIDELNARPSADLLWAIGGSGRVAAVDAAIGLLDHGQLSRLAGEVVCGVAGLSASDDQFWLDRIAPFGHDDDDALPEIEDEDLELDMVPAGDALLPQPNSEAIRSWWMQRRSELRADSRYICGRRLEPEQLPWCLSQLPTRRRHPLALELAARTQGSVQIATRAFSPVQNAQIRAIVPTLGALDMQCGLALE